MRLTIGRQILAVCMLVTLAFTGLNVYTYVQINSMKDGYDGIIKRSAPLVFDVKDLEKGLNAQSALVRAYILTADNKYRIQYDESRTAMDKTIESLESKLITPEGKEKVTAVKAALAEYHGIADMALRVRRDQGQEEAVKFVASAGPKIKNTEEKMTDITKFLTERMELRTKQNEAAADGMQHIILSLNAVGLLFAIVTTILLSRRISRPLAAVVAVAEEIAEGDLKSKSIQYSGNDEIADLLGAFTKMTSNLQLLVGQVVKASEQVAAASEQLTASAEQSAQAAGQVAETVIAVASGAEDQTKAIDDANTVVKDMVFAIGRIADSSNQVTAQSVETARAAEAGGEAVVLATKQMDTIKQSVQESSKVVQKLGDSSKQIGEIVDVITQIAGQTNLLALNAAIEAARAGEQGRGFAVVAEEVRKLAEQSHGAALKISDIVKDIQGETELAVESIQQGTVEVVRGTEVISATGSRFGDIVELVRNLNGQLHEISATTEELSAASDKVVHSVDRVKHIADETAGNTETISAAAQEQSASMQEIASSSQALAHMAEGLQEVVQRFKL